MPKQPFNFEYQLPPADYPRNLNETWKLGDGKITFIAPELRKNYGVKDFSIYKGRTLFDGSPISDFEPYLKGFQDGEGCCCYFIDTCGYFDGPEKEWERINTYWYTKLRWNKAHHHEFLNNYEDTVDFDYWYSIIRKFLQQFPDNPRLICDYAEYLRMTGEELQGFKMIISLYEKYKVADFHTNLKECYRKVQLFYAGVKSSLELI